MKAADALRTQDLARRLAEAEATIEALLSGQIDAVIDSTSHAPILLSHAQAALRESEGRLRNERDRAQRYLDTATVMLVSLDAEGRILLANRFACAVLGWTEAELLGRDWFETCVAPSIRDEVKSNFGTLQDGDVYVTEKAIVTRAGEERLIEWRCTPYRNAGGLTGTLSSGTDITERRTLEEQYRQAQKMEAVGRLASGVAHDFNNLLTVILGFAEFVNADTALPAQHGRDLDEIVKAARSASNLTRQLLAFSRQQVLVAMPLDVNVLITDMTGMLGRLIGEDIEITLALAPTLSLAVADRGQLEQVVMNLVVNARDAMPGGGHLIIETRDVSLDDTSLDHEEIVPGPYVMLAITDSGCGMTPETRRRLFEPFFTTKETGKGTGLGLSTTYGIVKQSRGQISVHSEPGRGTTFKVYLPCPAAGVVIGPAAPAAAAPAVARASETVLLVEDEAGVRLLSKRILQRGGYHVVEAANGDEAERLFAEQGGAIDLVVTDVVMPGCGGPELVARLQARSPSLRVLYMSGYTEQSAAQKAGIDRGIPFVEKPFTAAEFERRVRDALDR